MPNSFTVFPNVLPGNVTIGGNLTVSGDQLRIGAAAPFVRVGKDANGDGDFSINVGFDGLTRDNAANAAFRHVLQSAANDFYIQHTNPAGSLRTEAFLSTIFTDYTAHSHTGTVTEDTIVSKIIPANTLGANGGLRILVEWTTTTQGAGSSILRVYIGGVTNASFSASALVAKQIRLVLMNRNAANSNLFCGEEIDLLNKVLTGGVQSTTAVDYTVDQTVKVTLQSANATDVQELRAVIVEQMNSFGPV